MTDEYGEIAYTGVVCLSCAGGFHSACVWPEQGTCCCGGEADEDHAPVRAARGGRTAAPSDVTDPTSTGRKRATLVAPVFDGMVCEWAGLLHAGGGAVPIVGCKWNVLRESTKDGDGGDLHHGPDKNTLNNAVGVNLHRICKSCHHTWHKLNDPFYSKKRPEAAEQWLPTVAWAPHDAFTEATDEQLHDSNKDRAQINAQATTAQIAATKQNRENLRKILLGIAVDTEPDLL